MNRRALYRSTLWNGVRRSRPLLFLLLLIAGSCKSGARKAPGTAEAQEYRESKNDQYELSKPAGQAAAVLVLFGGYSEKAADIRREFKVLEPAKENRVAVLFMNDNQKLWLEQPEKAQSASRLKAIFEEEQLPADNVCIGGFSAGGNIALMISDFMAKNPEAGIVPKAVFAVDAPVDLAELYRSSEKYLRQNFSETAVAESTWLIETLGQRFGDPAQDVSKYEAYSVYTLQSGRVENLTSLKNTKIRLYTEPDTLWWKQNRMADYEQLNAYRLKRLSETLVRQGFNAVEYIPTQNRGYRANGERHPHSWSIVDAQDLMRWILAK